MILGKTLLIVFESILPLPQIWIFYWISFLKTVCFNGGHLGFSRYEKKSNDILRISFCLDPQNIFFWKDINQYVAMIVLINGCTYHGISHHIECFYLSEDGRFWDDHHQLRFQREDELFDYLMKVEYDFHPVISEKTFEIMRHFGWYEGRHTNTTE